MNAEVNGISLVTIIALIRKEIAETRVEGKAGKDGKQGGTGERGAKGDTGPQGKAGPKGGDGKQGKAGKDGKDGKDGEDAEEAVGIANIEQDVDDAIIITMTDGETYTIEMPLGKNTTEVHYKVGGGGSGSGGGSGTVDLSNYVQKPDSNTAWMVYKKGTGWSPVTTDLVATNSDVVFRDAKGRFKSTENVPELNNQLEVNRWFLEQFENIESSGEALTDAPSDNKNYGRKNGEWAYLSFDTKVGNRRLTNVATARLSTNQVLPEYTTEPYFALSNTDGTYSAPEVEAMANYIYLYHYNRIAFNGLDLTMIQLEVGDHIEFSNVGSANQCLIMTITACEIEQVGDRYAGVFDFEIKGNHWGDILRLKEGLQYTFHAVKSGAGGGAGGAADDHDHTDKTYYNVAVGTGTLKDNASGRQNTAFGYDAQTKRTKGNSNTAVGYGAMQDNLDGNYNVAIGKSAKKYGAGDYNTGVGSLALISTTGDFNVGLGYKAMELNETGSKLVALGAYTKATENDLTNAVAIGYEAQVDASYKIQLGNDEITLVHTHGAIQATDFLDADGNSIVGGGNADLPEMTDEATPNTLAFRSDKGDAKFNVVVARGITFTQGSISTNTADTWFLSGGETSTNGVKKNDAAGMRSSLSVYSKDEVDALGGSDLPEASMFADANTLCLRDFSGSANFNSTLTWHLDIKEAVESHSADTWFCSGGEASTTRVKKNDAEGMRASLNIYSKDEVDALSGGDSFFTDLGNNTIQYFGNELQVTLMNEPFHVGAKLGNDISCSGRFISGTECFVGGSIGLKFDSNSSSVVPVDEMGRPKVGIDLGSTAAKFKDGDFTGEVRATAFVGDGSQLTGTVSTKALVDAFQSIQMAVSNETTVAGIKKALTNSLGGLIEKLEG